MTTTETLGITMTAEGGLPDTHNEDEWKRSANHWDVTLTFNGKDYHVDYWMGSGLVEYKPLRPGQFPKGEWTDVKYNHYGPGKDALTKPRRPEVTEVLYSLSSDCSLADQSFDDFCADLGCDTDSRKAYASWEECRDQMFRIQRWLGASYDIFINTDWEEDQ